MTRITTASICRGSVFALILFLGSGCTLSRPRVYAPQKKTFIVLPNVAVVPAGTTVTLGIGGAGTDPHLKGELVEVRMDGFLILTETTSALVLVPYDRMTRMRFGTDVGINRSVNGSRIRGIPPLKEDFVRLAALARYTRYPFGLDDAQLQRLLEALGQSELVVIGS